MLTVHKILLLLSDSGIQFDEQYDFPDEIAAPLSSPYDEGNGSLTLVQTDGDLSTTGGYLVNTVQSTPAWGDLGALTISYPRLAGRSLIATLNIGTWEEMGVGFNAAAAPGDLTSIEHSIYAHATDGQFSTEAIANIFDSLSLSTDYRLIIMLRATGAWLLLDDGNTWQLIDVNDVGASTPLYHVYSILDGVGKLKTLRTDIIKANLRPNVVLGDNFSDTSAPFLSDGLGNPEGGGGGLTRTGTNWSSASNQRFNDNTGDADLLTNGNFSAWTADDPDGWTVSGESGSDPEVSEVGTGEGHGGVSTGMANFFSSATNFQPRLQQTILTIGKWYRVVTIIDTLTSGRIVVHDTANGLGNKTYTTGGTKILIGKALAPVFDMQGTTVTPTDVTVDSVSVQELPIEDLLDLVETDTPDVVARVDLTITEDTPGGIAIAWDSVSSPQNGLVVYIDRALGKMRVDKWLAGAFSSTLIDESVTYSAAKTLEVLLSDSDANGTWDVKVRYNGVTIGSTTFSDAGIIGNTIHGLFALTDGGFAEKENVWDMDLGTQYDEFYTT